MLLLNIFVVGQSNKVNAMTTTESTLATLIEKYGEENVIVENGLSIGIGQEKVISNKNFAEKLTWVSVNEKVVQVLNGNTVRGIASGTTYLIAETNGKNHILEVYVNDGSLLNKRVRTFQNVKNDGRYKVFIDAGHGGKDPGAVANGVRESDINLSVALKVEQKLKAKNIDVMMSRNTDVFVELKERARLANEYGAHVFVSIHHNAAGSSSARGIETYYHEDKPEHKLFADKIQKELISKTGANNRGVFSQDFLVNRETTMTSALVEGGYVTNPYEAAMLNTDSYQEKIANAIVDAVDSYLQENVKLYKWVLVEDKWYYINEATGEKKTGWVRDNGTYYLNEQGTRHKGWLYLNNNWYYFNEEGLMKTGWVYVGNYWYYLNQDGTMKTGWLADGGYWYYLTYSGAMKTDWGYVDGDWYFFNQSGAMKTGWVYVGNYWYYLEKSGAMQTGWLLDGDTWYFLTYSGAMKTGWLTEGGRTYYLASSGAMKTGWNRIDGFDYYFYSAGHMAINTVINGRTINNLGRAV